MTGTEDSLWNTTVGPSDYSAATEKYQQVILEQYKLCVEMADRVSARRNLANTFFLSVNSAVVATIAVGRGLSTVSLWVLAAGLAILVAQCAAWWLMVRSYRQLNAAKYKVIAMFEKRLPTFAYSRAEWAMLGEGRDWRRYLPLTHVEQWVPAIFSAAYLLAFVALVR
ncbi:RipA family octameric membrane protein [Streptomyces xanthochromogenes]|uniref:RipA family octameric membrane protein n=1 Tax=Streptomyces xanthochromogenes TaxID=67384 RepID=UPI0037F88B7F